MTASGLKDKLIRKLKFEAKKNVSVEYFWIKLFNLSINQEKFPYFSNPKLINSKNDNLYKI